MGAGSGSGAAGEGMVGARYAPCLRRPPPCAGHHWQGRHRLPGQPAGPAVDPAAAGRSRRRAVGQRSGRRDPPAHCGPPSSRLCPAAAAAAAPLQRACRRVSLDVFEHLLALDHSFHLQRNTGAGWVFVLTLTSIRTRGSLCYSRWLRCRLAHPPPAPHPCHACAGKVMRILDRGTSSIQDVMEVVLFSLLPQLVDVAVACAYMAARLQAWTAIIVGCTGARQLGVEGQSAPAGWLRVTLGCQPAGHSRCPATAASPAGGCCPFPSFPPFLSAN